MRRESDTSKRRYTLVLEELAAVPAAELLNDLKAVQAELDTARTELEDQTRTVARLEREEQMVAQMLRLKRWADDGVPGASETVAALDAQVDIAREATLSANVRAVMRQARGPLTPAAVQGRLEAVGVDATGTAIRTALRRWVERGELEKVGSRYRTIQPGT